MGDQESMLETMRGLRLLQGIGDDQLRPLASIARIEEVPAGGVMFREGQAHPMIYLIIDGSVALEFRVTGADPKRFQTVGSGELLGWSPLLGQMEMTATARALQPTRAVAIDATQLRAICEHEPRFGMEIMKRTAMALSKRLAATRLQLLDVYSQELPTVKSGPEGGRA